MAKWYSPSGLSRIFFVIITIITFYVVNHYPFVDAFITVIDQRFSDRRCFLSGSSTGHLFLSYQKTTKSYNEDGCNNSAIDYRLFTHDGWTCAYRYKAAQSPECQRRYQPLLLIHPVGIGLSSWFWLNLMQKYRGEVYAIDLIGCGTIGGDMWDPQIRGMFFPRTWSEQCASLLLQRDIRRPCAVVCQGAVAPVGVLLTHSYPQFVSHLTLTSPPEYKDMIQPIPNFSLERNYRFYQSPVWGNLAFSALENRRAIQLFSNLFLFDSPITVDDIFVTNAIKECRDSNKVLLRNPIKAFNSGLLLHRSLKVELDSIRQPTLILCGESDSLRNKNRQGYQDFMKKCTLKIIRGKNILPWEFPEEVCNELVEFIHTSRSA